MLAGKQAAEDRLTSRQRCFERLRNSVIMDDGVMASVDWNMTKTLSELPAVMSDGQMSQVVDVKLMASLSSSSIVNWCRTVRPIYPLRLHTSCTGSRDSLLVAVTTAMWGSSDAQLVEMVRRLVYVGLTRSQTPARLTERYTTDHIDESDATAVAQLMTSDTGSAQQWRRLCSAFSEHVDHHVAVRPIHVFVLSSVIRRPVIVVGETDCTGVYLPVVHAPTHCCTSPLIVVCIDDRFAPLVPRAAAAESPTEPGVPLWRADTDAPLAVRCLLTSESPELALTTYLHVVQLTHTSATAVRLFPVAKYDVVAPDLDVLEEFLAPEPHLLPVTAGGSYTTVLEQLTASAGQLGVDDVQYRPCQTAGCEFYALQRHNWKCSRCYANESPVSQSASPTAGHVLQMTSHVVEEPHWNGELTQRGVTSSVTSCQPVTAVICSLPGCNQQICTNSEAYCRQHDSRQHAPECVSAGCTRPAGDKYQGFCTNCYVTRDVIGRRVAMTTEASSCIMDFCSNVGSADCKGLCQQCFSTLCQQRLNSAFDPPPPPTAASTTNRGGSVRASVKCMMEGCRTMIPADSDVCEACRRKQLQAYEDIMRGHH